MHLLDINYKNRKINIYFKTQSIRPAIWNYTWLIQIFLLKFSLYWLISVAVGLKFRGFHFAPRGHTIAMSNEYVMVDLEYT